MSIQIIGAGFPRTGTTTLKIALESLGYAKTYHFKDLMMRPAYVAHWNELEHTGTTDFDALFDGYAATVDFPGYPYYKIMLERYPDAKVILTKRDFEGWYASVKKTIWLVGPHTITSRPKYLFNMLFNKRMRDTYRCFKFLRGVFFNKQFNHQFDDKAVAESVFNNHIAAVTAAVPKEQLLIYDVRDGWEPLCTFLSLEVPKADFPHVNKGENFHDMVEHMLREAAKG